MWKSRLVVGGETGWFGYHFHAEFKFPANSVNLKDNAICIFCEVAKWGGGTKPRL